MLAFIPDILFGTLLGYKVKPLWVVLVASLLVGLLSEFWLTLLFGAPAENPTAVLAGWAVHVAATLVCAFLARRRENNKFE